MKRLPFEHPTDLYDDKLFSIDEQLCSLLKERKDISSSKPRLFINSCKERILHKKYLN